MALGPLVDDKVGNMCVCDKHEGISQVLKRRRRIHFICFPEPQCTGYLAALILLQTKLYIPNMIKNYTLLIYAACMNLGGFYKC